MLLTAVDFSTDEDVEIMVDNSTCCESVDDDGKIVDDIMPFDSTEEVWTSVEYPTSLETVEDDGIAVEDSSPFESLLDVVKITVL